MKKILFLILVGLIGVLLVSQGSFASEERTIPHKFIGYSTSTAVSQSRTIYRITGVATGSNAVFGIYDVSTTIASGVSNIAVEGGEATSGDALPVYDFGPDGLILNSGASVIVSNCIIVIEYI